MPPPDFGRLDRLLRAKDRWPVLVHLALLVLFGFGLRQGMPMRMVGGFALVQIAVGLGMGNRRRERDGRGD